MVSARHRRPPVRIPSPPRAYRQLRMMTSNAAGKRAPKQKKRPPHWRKPEDVELREEIRDLRRDIALHPEAESGAKSDQTQATDKHPGTQERDKAGTERPKDKVNDFGQESLLCDIPSPTISSRGIRALNRAGGRIARLDAVQAPTTQANSKKANSGLERDVASHHGTRHTGFESRRRSHRTA